MTNTHEFILEAIDDVSYVCSPELETMYKLSPFVWRGADRFELWLRVVNYADDP